MDVTLTDLPNGRRVAEVAGATEALRSESDAVQLIGNASFQGVDAMLLDATRLPPAFFDLSTGVAGEILQKFANYRMRLVIVRASDGEDSESLKEFIDESNRGGQISFVRSREEGHALLGR